MEHAPDADSAAELLAQLSLGSNSSNLPSLRDYQCRIVRKFQRKTASGRRSILAQLPTGGGKTMTSGSIMRRFFERNKRCMFVANLNELIDQCRNLSSDSFGPSICTNVIEASQSTLHVDAFATYVRNEFSSRFRIQME